MIAKHIHFFFKSTMAAGCLYSLMAGMFTSNTFPAAAAASLFTIIFTYSVLKSKVHSRARLMHNCCSGSSGAESDIMKQSGLIGYDANFMLGFVIGGSANDIAPSYHTENATSQELDDVQSLISLRDE